MELPIEAVTSSSAIITQLEFDHPSLYYLEMRPKEMGRTTIMCKTDDKVVEILPSEFSVGCSIHEYGGRALEVSNGRIFFVSSNNNPGIYEIINGEPKLIFHHDSMRFGDLRFDKKRNQLFAVCETHNTHVSNNLVRINIEQQSITTIAENSDFVSSITLHNDQIAWVEWDHPHMQWDESRVHTSQLDQFGNLVCIQSVCACPKTSASSPRFSQEGKLYFMWDRSGYWNLYEAGKLEAPLFKFDADFAEPIWQVGECSYEIVDDTAIMIGTQNGENILASTHLETPKLQLHPLPYNTLSKLTVCNGCISLIAGSSQSLPQLIHLELPLDSKPPLMLPPALFSNITTPKAITQKNRFNNHIYSFFYKPAGIEKPPLIVKCHSGPTSRCSPLLNLQTQFFTSRGFAFLETNFSGSTGYGRQYRERLNYKWGELDVTDCIDATSNLIDNNTVDPNNIFIMGSSSGGLTALSALSRCTLFKAGIILYGVTDLIELTKETHKFEQYYLESLIGPYPNQKDLYIERSPSSHFEQISSSLLIFQGLKDKVVSPTQATNLHNIFKHSSELIEFENEGHGFKQADSKTIVLEKTLSFIKSLLRQ
ncbi:MAG: prolyl oligopeptidase family serine peptidase [Rhabdochlamydiaceae bacterium]|nr:prolyl oligopeptidase family serine peptidase [Candidatus Amphrikana amoebophyrae]